MIPGWKRCTPAADDGDVVSSRPVEPLSRGHAAWETLLFLGTLWESLGHFCEWVTTYLLFPLLIAILIALPITVLAAGIFYNAELPMRILHGVCVTFLAVSVPVVVGSWAVLVVLFITSACRRIGNMCHRVITSFARVTASARRKARPSPGGTTLWDRWLDGV